MNLSRSIDFLLENGRDVVKYRLHKEILRDLTPAQEEELLARVLQSPDYQLLLTHVKPNGYIGIGMHSWDKFKASYLDDGETAARLLCNYAIPREMPIVRNFVAALRNDAVLEQEFSYYHPEQVRFANRALGIHSGSTLDVLIYTMQALLGYGDDPEVAPFVDVSYRAFVSLLDVNSLDEITNFNSNLKRKYNYPTVTPDTYFPCQYHLETLAVTQSWRTEASVSRLIDAIHHHDRILKPGDGFAVKLGGKQVGPAWAYMQPFLPLSFPGEVPNQRKTLTALARIGGERIDVVRRSAETVREMLDADGVMRVSFEDAKQKKCFRSNLRAAHSYAEIGLEPDHKKDTALWVELTFWAVQFLHILSEAESPAPAKRGDL